MYVKHYSSSWNIVWEPKGISVCEFSTGFLKDCIFEALKWVYNFKNCTSSNLSSLCSISLQSSGSSMISSSSEVYQNIKLGCWFILISNSILIHSFNIHHSTNPTYCCFLCAFTCVFQLVLLLLVASQLQIRNPNDIISVILRNGEFEHFNCTYLWKEVLVFNFLLFNCFWKASKDSFLFQIRIIIFSK